MNSYLEADFLNVPLRRKSMHIYYVRNAILAKLKAALPRFHGKLLDVGCCLMPYKSMILASNRNVSDYVGLDLADHRSYANQRDLTWDGSVIPLPDGSIDCAMATEVLEHCPYPDKTLTEINRVLKPGGTLFLTVPFIWMLHEVPYDEYRYTPFALRRLVESSNFKVLELSALGGWNASLAQFVANWLYYSDGSRQVRRIGKVLFFPIFKSLIKRDKVPAEFETGQMINGLACLAQKEGPQRVSELEKPLQSPRP